MATTVTNGTPAPTSQNILDEVSTQAPPGTVLPPRSQRDIIEKTAGYIARNGVGFEERLKTSNAKVAFVFPEDAYHAYYKWRVEEIKAGRGTSIAAGRKEGEGQVSFTGREEREGPEKPEEFAFSARMPTLSAQDLEVVRLTALFVAKNGRSWMTTLSQREAGNFQFDFLRPQHSLYQFFSRLVDQYTDLINGDSVDSGRPQKKRILDLEANVTDRFRILDRAKKRAEWFQHQEAQKVELEEKEEKEKIAYAQIDWHDFVVVETVVFDEADENVELPPPQMLNDLQSLSLEQKGMASIGSDRRIEEAVPSFDDYDTFYGQQAPAPSPAQQMPPPQQPYSATPPAQQQQFQPPPANPADQLQADRARARAAQEAAKSSTNPNAVKIRKDYVPAAQARRTQQVPQGFSICPNCSQQIANTEMEAHLRIEMLSPDWRDQYRVSQQRSSTTNLSTADVAANLKRLASQRSDVFDPSVHGGQGSAEEEEQERRRKVERRAYDGVSGVPNAAALGAMGPGGLGIQGPGGQSGGGQQPGKGGGESVDVQEQIRLIREKAAKNG